MEQILDFLAYELLTWQFWLGVMAGMLLLVLGALLFWLADNARFDREIAAGLHDRWEPPAGRATSERQRSGYQPAHPLPGRAGSDL
jgi:hypothetical protein